MLVQWTARAALQSVSSLGDMGILSDSGYCSSFSRFQNAQPKLKMGQKAQTKVCLSHCYYIAFGLRQGCYGRLAVVSKYDPYLIIGLGLQASASEHPRRR